MATNKQPVFRYQVHESTNVAGWNIPLEFYLVQYWLRADWADIDLTARGHVTAIGPTTRPEIPPEVWERVQRN